MTPSPQVSDGNVLVADLLRLSAALPPALAGGASPSAPVLFDFRYLKDPEAHERRVEADRQSAALDDRFREARAGCPSVRRGAVWCRGASWAVDAPMHFGALHLPMMPQYHVQKFAAAVHHRDHSAVQDTAYAVIDGSPRPVLPRLRLHPASSVSWRPSHSAGRETEASSQNNRAPAQAHAGVVEDVFRWLERVLAYHGQLTEFLARLQSGAFIHASVESLLLVRTIS